MINSRSRLSVGTVFYYETLTIKNSSQIQLNDQMSGDYVYNLSVTLKKIRGLNPQLPGESTLTPSFCIWRNA